MNQPHDLTDVEIAHFLCRDAFVACSVLKESLEPLPAGDDESPLRILPAAVLTAMRGTYFGDVVDPGPWLAGELLLGFFPLPLSNSIRVVSLKSFFIS